MKFSKQQIVRLVPPRSARGDRFNRRLKPQWQTHFIVDSLQNVFCKECGGRCKSIPLQKFTMHWCNNHFCENVFELRLSREGVWSLHDYGAIHQDKDALEEIFKMTI